MASILAKFDMHRGLANGSNLSKQVVAECLLVLRKAVPSMELDPEVAWTFLKGMSEKQLRESVGLVIQNLTEVYPNMPWIALLHEARKRWCKDCDGTGKYTTQQGYETRCLCRK